MDDKFIRQYDYKANSNLVLPTDTSLIDKRPSNETTGEVQSLVGRISGRMGDKVSTTKKRETEDKKNKTSKKKSKQGKNESSRLIQDFNDPRGFSVAEVDSKDLLYQPKSEITKKYYDLIIKFISKQLGFQPDSIIRYAADEIISTMKNPNYTEDLRRTEVNKLLSTDENLDDFSYNELCNLCKNIYDWDSGQTKNNEDVEEEDTGGIGVILSDNEDSSDSFVSEVRDSDGEFDLEEMFEKEKNENKQLQDLDELAKRQVNIIPKIDIPDPIRKEGYQEYHIAAKKRHTHSQDNLIRISELPEIQRKAFGDIKSLNLIQSQIYKKAISTDKSLLICAPTGAGKTNIAIMAMLREILKHQKKDGTGFETEKFKIIYVAPIKALVQEVVENFTKRLGGAPYNLKVEEFTGDHQLDQTAISRSQIIVCTPEKWDIVTRKSVDRLYTKIVRLVIFDEIHLLHNERGATLEALIARIKRHKHLEGEPIRIIGLSATLPNYKDVAHFIAPHQTIDDSTFYFNSTYRPIPLRQQYIAMNDSKKALRMINNIVYEKVIERLAEHAQILIFVHSRPDTAKTAESIKCRALEENKLALLMSSESAVEQIRDASENLSPKLKELLQFGIGIHHAGLSKSERSVVEDLFRGKYIKVLVSTATLAWGVNLPARTVIIKGTQVYKDGRWTDLDSLDVTQMLGRAGRPGFDKEGEGIVITQQSQVDFYMSLMTEQLPVESKLIARLAEFINAECVVGNIESTNDIIKWISETYLSSRMESLLSSPDNNGRYLNMYGIDLDAKTNDPKLTMHKRNLAYIAACALDDRGLIIFDRASGTIKSTELGRIASHYNCSSRTIKLFYDSIHEHTSDVELFRTFSLADEFSDIYVRTGEATDLKNLINNDVPFPIDDKRVDKQGPNKVNALLQVYIFRMNIESSDLISDMHFIRENAARLARAIHEIVLMKGYAHVAELSLDLCRKIDKRMTVCHSALRQFSGTLDADIITKLERKDYNIDELRVLKSDKLTELLRCERKYGEKVYKLLKYLPKLKIEASIKPISTSSLKIELTIQPDFSWNEEYHNYTELFWLFVEDVNQEVLLHHDMIHIRRNLSSDVTYTTFYVPYLNPINPFYFIKILPDKWFGCDHQLPIYIEKLNLPDETIITTSLSDLDPLRVRYLESSYFEDYYRNKFKNSNFNQIQTEAFKDLYLNNEDIVLLASAGSGKTTCAEFSIIRNIKLYGSSFKCGYIAANQQSAQLVYDNWKKLFADYGVVLLEGNHRIDARRVKDDKVNIVIGNPESWHVLTLTRENPDINEDKQMTEFQKLFNRFQLIIIDDIHLLFNDRNSVLEWVCSKIRYITKRNGKINPDKRARIVALGSPMACAESIKSWLTFERGAREPILFNYSPSIRPVKLNLIIQKFTHYNYQMRLLTMKRPVYRYVADTSRDKPIIIFVANYTQAIDVCEMLLNFSKSDGITFIDKGKPAIRRDTFHDKLLEKYLSQGVGFLYSGTDKKDRLYVEELYENCQFTILVATVSTCWSISCRSYLTIIMDTEQLDGFESKDYDLTDVMQMIGLTGRPLSDHECKCIIMTQRSKASYYERYLDEPLTAESELPVNLITHVLYEIARGSLKRFSEIYNPYLAHTFFYKRITINPNYYGVILPESSEEKKQVFESFFNNLVYKVAQELNDKAFITMEGNLKDPNFNAREISKSPLEHYIYFETISKYTDQLSNNTKTLELIHILCMCSKEFDCLPIRNGELPILKSIQRRHRVDIDINQMNNYSYKVMLLILSYYQKTDGKEDPLDGELYQDREFIVCKSRCLLMAIVDIAFLNDYFSLAKTTIQLSKKLVPYHRQSIKPNIDMKTDISRNEEEVTIKVTISRENEPYSTQSYNSFYLNENWYFLVHRKDDKKKENFLLCQKVKTPNVGVKEYKLRFIDQPSNYELYFMSDFYPTKEDRKVEFST